MAKIVLFNCIRFPRVGHIVCCCAVQTFCRQSCAAGWMDVGLNVLAKAKVCGCFECDLSSAAMRLVFALEKCKLFGSCALDVVQSPHPLTATRKGQIYNFNAFRRRRRQTAKAIRMPSAVSKSPSCHIAIGRYSFFGGLGGVRGQIKSAGQSFKLVLLQHKLNFEV